MSDTVIRVENLGKKYVLGHQKQERYSTLRDGIANSVKSLVQRFQNQSADKEEFWALKDVSFEIKRGDRVGIIGRNGAGKSTLLKILSRITEPTQGQIRIKGRVASLLEVGTGFHPELTGRENIYLNGAILGMSKVEIQKKFDEIVAFAEVEKFLDTPVKRYSSGMYVRLAFAVAAHLEPEILVVDEVLAVGDIAFQKKCLGKMEDVARNEGRTVLFVSHNMAAVSQLCTQAFMLQQGKLVESGLTKEVVESYFKVGLEATGIWHRPSAMKSDKVSIVQAKTLNSKGNFSPIIDYQDNFSIEVTYENYSNLTSWIIVVRVTNSTGQHIFTSWDTDSLVMKRNLKGSSYKAVCFIPSHFLRPDNYSVTLGVYLSNPLRIVEYHEHVFGFEISTVGYTFNRGRVGTIAPLLHWQTEATELLSTTNY